MTREERDRLEFDIEALEGAPGGQSTALQRVVAWLARRELSRTTVDKRPVSCTYCGLPLLSGPRGGVCRCQPQSGLSAKN